MPRPLVLLLKAAISIALLYLALRTVDLSTLGERLRALNIAWIAIALIVLAAQVALQALRWWIIVIACGIDLRLGAVMRINFIAQFFNQVLPSTVGGDAARIWWLGRASGGWQRAAYSVLIDRGVGVFALALIVMACLPWTLAMLRDPIARTTLMVIGGGAMAGAAVFLAIGLVGSPWIGRFAPLRHLAEVSRTTWRIMLDARTAVPVGLLSITIHLMTIAAVWCMVQSVAASASLTLLLFLIPPVVLIATIPVSIAGWGVREGSMIAAFSYAGLSQGDGLIVSVLIGLTGFVIGGAGGIIWIASRADLPRPPVDDVPAVRDN